MIKIKKRYLPDVPHAEMPSQKREARDINIFGSRLINGKGAAAEAIDDGKHRNVTGTVSYIDHVLKIHPAVLFRYLGVYIDKRNITAAFY